MIRLPPRCKRHFVLRFGLKAGPGDVKSVKQKMKKAKQYRFITGILVLAGLLILVVVLHQRTPPKEITGTELTTSIAAKQITRATAVPSLYPGIFSVEGTLKKDGAEQKFFVTTHLDADQVKKLAALDGVKIQVPGQGKGQWLNVLTALLIVGLVGWVFYHQTSMGKGQNSQKVRARPAVRFEDVAGVEEAKAEVQEVVDFLRNPKKYKRLGGKLPKGILLIGPPGTGKTMLAKAIAGEADANFFSAHGSDFNEVFVGVGAKRIRELFRQALKSKPAIIFIDEIDCLGKNRKMDTNGELQQTNNALLAAMDGFESSEGVVVLAATNRPEDLDDALMRPGRFDRKVFVPYPDMKGRRAILDTHVQDKPVRDKETVLSVIARTTPGMSGADLANLVNEAAILCAQQDADEITLTELESARDKVRFGKERRSMVLKPAERELVACHEAGHAVINLHMRLLPHLYKVSIVPRGQALGTTRSEEHTSELQSLA